MIIANGGAVDVIDATNPTSLTKVGTVQVTPDPGQVVGLATNGSVVYAAFQGLDDAGSPINGVAAIDVSSPSAPVALGTFDLGEGTPYTIASVGAVVYVGQDAVRGRGDRRDRSVGTREGLAIGLPTDSAGRRLRKGRASVRRGPDARWDRDGRAPV